MVSPFKRSAFSNFSFVYVMTILALVVLSFGLMFLHSGIAKATYWSSVADDTSFSTTGSGTTASPYKISKATQLATVARKISTYKSNSFVLTNNIDLSDHNWTPIGTVENLFAGTFDGAGFSIIGLKIEASDGLTVVGLFGYVGKATIKNLDLISETQDAFVTAKTNTTTNVYAGALSGYISSSATITNVSNKGVNVFAFSTSGYAYAGGLVGYSINPSYSYVSNMGNVLSHTANTKSSYAGGIVGYASGSSSSMEYGRNDGIVEAHTGGNVNTFSGGIMGYNAITLTNVYNNGKVFSGNLKTSFTHGGTVYNRIKPASSFAGGIVGYGTKNITNAFNTGAVIADAQETVSSFRTSLTSTKSLEESTVDGAFYGVYAWAAHASSYANYDMSGEKKEDAGSTTTSNVSAYAGGIAGYGDITITNAYNDATILGGKQRVNIIYVQSIRLRMDNPYTWIFGSNFEDGINVYYATVSYTSEQYYGAINGNRSKATTNTFGHDAFLDYNRSIKVNSYKNGKTLTEGSVVSGSASGTTTVTPGLTKLSDYFSDVEYKLKISQSGSNLSYQIYMNYTLRFRQNGISGSFITWTVSGLNESLVLSQNISHKVMSATEISASTLGTGWKTQAGVNGGRPFLEAFYW